MMDNTMMMRARGLSAAAGLVVAAAATAAVPETWTLELVARSSLNPAIPAFRLPQGSSLSSQPVSLDEEGGVAFRVFLDGSSGATEGIFYGDTGSGGLILSGSSGDPIWGPDVDARNGRVAIRDGLFSGIGAAYTYDTAGNLLETFPPGGPLAISGPGTLTLSDDGALCYRGDFGAVGDRAIIDEFVGGVRTQTNLADTFSGQYSFILTPRMNANRSAAMNLIPNSGPSRRIVRFDPGVGGYTETVVAETGSGFSSFVNSTAIASDGRVAFNARRSADSTWQVTRFDDGAPLTVIAEGGQQGIVNSNLANFPPVVNASGWVAFRVEDSTSGSTALFVGDGDNLVRIVTAGDVVPTDLGPITAGFNFGGTTGVQALNSSVDINDAGQVSFGLFLENGTIGIFVATPGSAGCNAADVAEPFGTLNIDDVLVYLDGFADGDPLADLAAPAGIFNIDDVLAFVDAFAGGCP